MISRGTRLTVSDNSGAKEVCCIQILGGSNQKYGKIGDFIIASVKSVKNNVGANSGGGKVGDVVKCLIVRTRSRIRRSNGTYVSFSDNSVVLVNKSDGKMVGTRVFGMIARDIKDRCLSEKMMEVRKSVLSLAPMTV